ncbi:hypothetical protein JKP88DRAFT_274427 [Tribonema minus]|uniref:Uncharacterized protein n=1 Tax=Tribonema minus TaxID=303371 RepID=A0A835YJT1_9STRA|nr:hypothetical protein JKP88DRAFT_274427 [Tribonema minus]
MDHVQLYDDAMRAVAVQVMLLAKTTCRSSAPPLAGAAGCRAMKRTIAQQSNGGGSHRGGAAVDAAATAAAGIAEAAAMAEAEVQQPNVLMTGGDLP